MRDLPQLAQAEAGDSPYRPVEVLVAVQDMPLPASVPNVKHDVDPDGLGVRIRTSDPARTVAELVRWCDASERELTEIDLRRPSLQDMFLKLLERGRTTIE
jgi:hypothetical protein